MTKFRKGPTGTYGFTINGVEFIAIRNEAGFAHRDWDLYSGDGERILDDQLATRQECVEAAAKRVTVGALRNAYERLAEERASGCAPEGTVEYWQSEVLRLGGWL